MFKLESYITPIILNHVAKYVKNIRPEDSQFSLWEGEVAFQNLDLRLDVLEEELNLPFEFLSGHVHELTILVPWMKITSEPIKITINTIEFVLKLKDNKANETSPSPKKKEKIKRVSRAEDGSQQQGYMPGLVNKIINNIMINCHNIILKYVEEDIVVSMNIQLLSFSSADESWKPAFTDIQPVRVFMRKLVQVSDLTICLDKRNAAGQIDVCQEPILYRCSLEIRIVRKYNTNTAHLGSTTRIAIFTKLMEMNVSSLQFPMAMRLFKLLLALKAGELKSKSTTDAHDEESVVQDGTASSSNSYLAWAWNLIPSFGFAETDELEKIEEDTSGQLLEIGIYIEALNFTLKSSEFITDSIVGATKKIRYSPIVKLILGGIYSETVIISDRNWSNTKAGCSSIAIEPLDAYKDEELDVTSLVTTAALSSKNFLDRSLFDETFIERDWTLTSIEEYNIRVTEEYLLYRSPVIAFDLVDYKEQVDPDTSVTEAEENTKRSTVIYRILASSMTLRYNQTYARIASVLHELIRTYDYPPYCEEKLDANGGSPKLHPPLLDDFDSLMIGIPLKIYKFSLNKINFEFHPKTEPTNMKSLKKLPVVVRKNLPFFKITIDNIEGQWTTPIDPDKLVHTTCQLPDKPIELLNACYENAQIRFKDISLSLKQQTNSSNLFRIPKGSFHFGDLLQSSLWKNDEVPVRKLDVALDSVILEFSKAELMTALRLMTTITEYSEHATQKISQQQLVSIKESLKVRSQFKKLSLETKKFRTTTLFRGSLKLLQSHIVDSDTLTSGVDARNALITTKVDGQRNKWLEWYLQIPNGYPNNIFSTKMVLALWIDEYNLLVNENLVNFLKFMEADLPAPKEPTPDANPSTSRTPLVRQSSKKSLPSERLARKTGYPEETIHVSSERDEKVSFETNGEKELRVQFSYKKLLPFFKTMVLRIQIAKGNVHINSSLLPQATSFTEIALPQIVFNSASAEHINRYNVQNEFHNSNEKTKKETFPWTCSISSFGVQSSVDSVAQAVIHPIQTSITIAMTHKTESVNEKKTDQQQPKVVEENEAEKSKQTQITSHAIPTVDSDYNSRTDFHHKTTPAGSVSALGRSQSSEENEQVSKGSEKRKSRLQEAVENVFTIRKKNKTRDIYAISLHVDTSPIHAEFNSQRTQLIREHLTLLLKAISLLKMSQKNKATAQQQNEIQIVTSAEENASIKEFLDIETNSDSSIQSMGRSTVKLVFSILLQWTITKFTVDLDASQVSRCKLILDMEDVILSVDKREDFTKFTSKIGTLNTRFFEKGAANEFVLSDLLRIKMQTDSTQSPLFNMIITTVGVRNFFNKIGAKRKEADLCRDISEVIVNMEAIELIVDIDRLAALAPAIIALTASENIVKETDSTTNVTSTSRTVCQLPMVHLNSKGFTVYLPTETKKSWCSVLILKVSSLKVSPNLENPLQRCPVRADVFQKAAQMGILSTPGSIIEDRQYELTLLDISAATGNWNEILAHMKEHTDNFHNTNPAFEWNNQSRKTSLDLRKIFSNFTFITIYAPCITCNKVLICGQAIEFNCSNDLIASLTTDQLSLFSRIITNINNITQPAKNQNILNQSKTKSRKVSSQTSLKRPSTQQPTEFRSATSTYSLDTILDSNQRVSEEFEKPITDSGFFSCKKSITKKIIKETSASSMQKGLRQMPHSISLVAGMFIIHLNNYTRVVTGIPQGDEPIIVETLTPLLSLHLSQPSFLISQTIYETTKRFTLFNLTLNLHHTPDQSDEDVPKNLNEQIAPEILFDTKLGNVSSSGIPPPLIVLKTHRTKSKKLEIDLILSKPCTLRLTEKTLQSLTQHIILYYQALLENPCFHVRSEKTVFRATKIEMMRNMLFNADHFNLKINMISLNFYEKNKYNLKFRLMDLRFLAKFLSRPEKLNAKCSIGGLYMQSNHRIYVHPIGGKCNVDLVQESWNRLPLVTANIKLNVIHCNVGVELIADCSEAIKGFSAAMEFSNSIWENFLCNRCGDTVEINRDRLSVVCLPQIEQKKATEPKEEFYQDDLRAGAFQFIEMVSDTFLPMPYQIQIIKKNYGIICWRYPQPRKMFKIHIFPVPMPVPNPIRIKCRMEYFSEAHESFLHYCDFWLSETVSKSIKLPDRDITAHIWRVVILQSLVSINRECFDTSEEDEELRTIISIGIDDILNSAKKESDFILHPKVLVGCMRIDTVFRPSAIPKFQILLDINGIQVNLENHENINSILPKTLKNFKIAMHNKPINQTFLSLNIEKTSIHALFYSLSNYSVHSELSIDVKCLDYGYLNLIYVIEQTNLSGYVRVNGPVESNIMADKLSLNLGPSVIHNLCCAKQNWENYFRDDGIRRTFLISKFIVGNRTNTTIIFGQSRTGERITLYPRECCKYSFPSMNYDQGLTFYISDGQREHASSSILITLDFPEGSNNSIQHVPIDNKYMVVKIRRISTTQYYILLKGQIELISMVNNSFLLEFYQNDKKADNNEYHVEKKYRSTFLQPVTDGSNICIRLKLEGERGKGQTGNIPLKSNKNYPWLVKVPIMGPDKFISYWVRIIRENISESKTDTCDAQKILISIWPIFEIRSMMTCPLNIIESSTNSIIKLAPEGKTHQLQVPATHQTDHKISFIDDEFISSPDFNLTLKAIDWNKFFWYDEKVWTVEKTLTELANHVVLKWPIKDDEEIRIKRYCMLNNKTNLLYKCSPSREFSCTLNLEVAPWGTFINATANKICVRYSDTGESIAIVSNGITVLPQIKTEFFIEISNCESLPIVIDKSEDNSKRKCYRLNENDSVDIVILIGEQIFKFLVEFCTENERNVFFLKPKYVIANMTKQPLVVLPFSLDQKESISRKDIAELTVEKELTVPISTTSEYSLGICIDQFDSNVLNVKRSPDSVFAFFVCIKTESRSETSIPIALMHPFNRKCFSLQHNECSIPLSASLLEKNGQYFISIFDDTSPMILLNNQTDLTLFVAQSVTAENNKVTNIIPEYDGKHFEWYQISRPRSLLYYTPPTSYVNFPDVESTICSLSIALYNDNHNKKDIKWSKSIHTDASWEKFLHIPTQGDVKVIVCDKHRIIRVSIFYIAQQLEFSVKDLRSRLLTPQSSDLPDNIGSNQQIDDTATRSDELLQRVHSTISCKCIHQQSDPTSVPNSPVKIRFSVNEINVNIFVECKTVDYLKKEIFALYIDDFVVTYDNSKRLLNLVLTNLQIDNQLFSSGNYDFPVVLCSQKLYKRSPSNPSVYCTERYLEQFNKLPMAEITAIFYDDELKLHSVGCRVSPIRAYIEDTYLNDLLDYLVECCPNTAAFPPKYDDYYVELQPGEFLIPKYIAAQASYMSEPLKMQCFRIDSMNVMLSVHTCVRLYIALDHSPLQFSTYERQNILTLPLRFGHTLGMHYLSGALFGAGWVVGSLEMLGSPSGLARSFSAGLKDFVSMPVQGLLRGPWGFVVGVTQGSASLLRNITAGTVNSVSKLAASVSRNLDRLTLDPEHIQRTEALRRCRPQGFTEGFTQGITGLGISILGAVGGIARHTLEARSPAEVVTGMGKGIVGAFAKPISGAAELVALTGQGVLHTVGFNAMPQQRAPSVPRNIAAQVSEQKVWNLLLSILSSVLEKDQILFYHEVTLVMNNNLHAGYIFLTSTILALFETESAKFSFINPIRTLKASVDANDKTLINITVNKQQNEHEEGTLYTTERIMLFLQTSSHEIGINMVTEPFNDIQIDENSRQTNQSFYISENLGQYLIEYLKILRLRKS